MQRKKRYGHILFQDERIESKEIREDQKEEDIRENDGYWNYSEVSLENSEDDLNAQEYPELIDELRRQLADLVNGEGEENDNNNSEENKFVEENNNEESGVNGYLKQYQDLLEKRHPKIGKSPSKEEETEFEKHTMEIDQRLNKLHEAILQQEPKKRVLQRKISNNRRTVTTSGGEKGSTSSVYIANNKPYSNDPEKQRLRYLVAKFQGEYENARAREKKAIEIASVFHKQMLSYEQQVNLLRKSNLDKERQVVELREMIDELNGALERANVGNETQNLTKNLIDRMMNNYSSIVESLTSKKELIDVIEKQKEELQQHSKLLKKLTTNQQ
ncbi:hypothetical protein ABK040_006745 [Willaertia magna]